MNKFFALLLLSSLTLQTKAVNQDLAKLVGVPAVTRLAAMYFQDKDPGLLDKLASGTLNASAQRKFVEFGSVTDYAIDTALHTALLTAEDTEFVKDARKNKYLKPILTNWVLKSFAYCTAVTFLRTYVNSYVNSYTGSPVCSTPATSAPVTAAQQNK